MGSDSSPEFLYQGALQAHELLKNECHIAVIGTPQSFELCKLQYENAPLEFIEAPEEVLMDESPLLAVRRKQNSSMAVGIRRLKENQCDAFVSAGNTGAINAYSSIELNKLPGISRPALLADLPTQKGKTSILDVGANISFRPESFFQFALMGAAYQKVKRGIQKPKIGLLNIGVEIRKGTRKLQTAYTYFLERKDLMEKHQIFFEGNVESRDLFDGNIDVLVTDGFTGNVFLKTTEGVSSFILKQIHKRFLKQDLSEKNESFKELEKYLDYEEYPGALLIGVDGVVVKCHGSSSMVAMLSAIKGAYSHVKSDIVPQIKRHLENFHKLI